VNGLRHQVDAAQFVRLTLVDAALLAAAMTILTFASRWLGFSRADEITIVFCGSKKSPRQRRADRNPAVRGPCWPRHPAGDGVPIDPAHGLRVAGSALRGAADPAPAFDGSTGCNVIHDDQRTTATGASWTRRGNSRPAAHAPRRC
jgi:hypothetical protein